MSFEVPFVFEYWRLLLSGALTTITLSFLICLSALPLAVVLLSASRSELVALSVVSRVFSRLVKAIPALVLLLWVYYALPLILPLRLTPYTAALIAFTINLTPFLADALLSGVRAVPPQQFEVACVMGVPKGKAFRQLILPQAARTSAPDIFSWFITELKLTSLASLIGLGELMHSGNTIISETYQPLEVYTTIGLVYALIILVLERSLERFARLEYRRCL